MPDDVVTPAVDYAADLIAMLERGALDLGHPSELDKWIAMRESDRERLKSFARWDPNNKGRPYKIDPLPEKISVAFADFLWGEDPTIEPANEADAENLLEIVENNDLADELHNAEQIKSSEGSVWWRIYRDDAQFPHPIIEWHSRTEVVPYFRGRKLLAVAFVSVVEERDAPKPDTDTKHREIWRRLEVYGPGVVYNRLYRSADRQRIGQSVPLEEHEDTADFLEEWRHGLPMLAGRIVNRRGRNPDGRSDYAGVEDLLFDLNEAHTVDSENFRLAGKKRAVMPRKYAGQEGQVDPGEEIFFSESLDELDPDNTFKILEYTYEAESSIKRKEDLTLTIFTRVGLARQFVDPNQAEGFAASGTALRVRLIPTTLTARGKAKPWDEELPVILGLAQQVDALGEGQNGFGRTWAAAGDPPAVERGSILPEDRNEDLQYHSVAVGADLESIQTAIEDLHPDWDEDRVTEELRRIKEENPAPFGGDLSLFGGGVNGETG